MNIADGEFFFDGERTAGKHQAGVSNDQTVPETGAMFLTHV